MQKIQPMNMMPTGMSGPPDFNKLFKEERGKNYWRNMSHHFLENMELIQHKFDFDKCDKLLLEKLRKKAPVT